MVKTLNFPTSFTETVCWMLVFFIQCLLSCCQESFFMYTFFVGYLILGHLTILTEFNSFYACRCDHYAYISSESNSAAWPNTLLIVWQPTLLNILFPYAIMCTWIVPKRWRYCFRVPAVFYSVLSTRVILNIRSVAQEEYSRSRSLGIATELHTLHEESGDLVNYLWLWDETGLPWEFTCNLDGFIGHLRKSELTCCTHVLVTRIGRKE